MAYLMIVDDDEDFGRAVSKALRDAGHEVQIELDIHSAITSMEKRPPELVILDVMFPEDGTAGFELARTMRHYKKQLSNIPILMLTAVNTRFPLGFSSRDIDDQWLPVNDFLEKPVRFDLLRNKVSDLLHAAGSSGTKLEEGTGPAL